MQIIEVRNDILKLAYSPFQNGLLLSDFLLVSEGTKSVLAQVIGIESSSEQDINIAFLKGCLSVDETGKISSYLGFIPSTGAEISPVAQEQVISMLCDTQTPVIWGYLAQHDNVLFKTDKELLKNKPLILMDDYENYNVIANNLVYLNKKLGEKTVIIDFDGTLKIDNAFYVKIGEDLKLPLSYNTLDYIYENDLKEESLSTQAVVQDIIIELQNYIKTLPEGFLPFSTVKDVVYAQYEENKIPELMLFKNKFVKYAQQDILAQSEEDFNSLNEAIKENDIIVIDATDVEPIWHKLVLNYVAKDITTPCSFIAKLENDNATKKTILDIYNNRIINPILTANYSFEFVNVLKSIAKNLILFPPTQLVNDFATYSAFMKKLNRDEYVICGENTLYLSFLLRLTYIDTNMSPDYIEKEIQQDVDKLYRSGAQKATTTIQSKENVLDEQTSAEQTAPKVQDSAAIEDEALTEEDLDFLDELDSFSQEQEKIQPEPNQEQITFTQDIVQNVQPIEQNIQSETPAQIYTEPNQQTINNVKSDTHQNEADLSKIQEQSSIKNNKLPQEEIVQATEKIPPATEASIDRPLPPPQPIPVYSVPELEIESPVDFKEGNFVYHEKYGKGVIEKIMNYGNKTLCSIQFEEVGRRLLDPNLAGLKQI